MTRFSLGRTALLLVMLWLGAASLALAQEAPRQGDRVACARILDLPSRLPDPALRIDRIHRGLRSMLNNWSRALSDNRFGPYTRQALNELCLSVPLDPPVDAVAGTLALAQDYGELAEGHELWRSQAEDPRLLPRLKAVSGGGVVLLPLRLAGPPALARSALIDGSFGATCAGVDPGTLSPSQKEGLAALTRAGGGLWPNLPSLCPAFTPVLGSDGGIAVTLDSYAALERAMPGALAQLVSPAFADWLAEDQRSRVPRLLGTNAAVVALLAEYRAARPARPDAPVAPEPEETSALDY